MLLFLVLGLALPTGLPGQETRGDEDGKVYDHGDPTEYEQLMLQLVNQARANPKKTVKQAGIKLNAGLPKGAIDPKPKPPLAFQKALLEAARKHSEWMLQANTFSHTGKNNSTELRRIKQAGYPLGAYWSVGENIGWGGTTASVDMAENVRARFQGLLKSPRHRTNIFKPVFRDIGIGIKQGNFQARGKTFNSVMVTQNFAVSSATESPFVTGVVYRDSNDDKSYDPGEGISGVTVQAEGGEWIATTSKSGGYSLPYAAEAKKLRITFSGGTLDKNLSKTVKGTGANVRLDLAR